MDVNNYKRLTKWLELLVSLFTELYQDTVVIGSSFFIKEKFVLRLLRFSSGQVG